MLRCWMFSCTSTNATLLDVLLHFHKYVMLRCWMFSCTSTNNTSCHAAGCSLALPHIRHATLLDALLNTSKKRNFSAKPSANKAAVSCLQNTRFSTFEATSPRDLHQNFIFAVCCCQQPHHLYSQLRTNIYISGIGKE